MNYNERANSVTNKKKTAKIEKSKPESEKKNTQKLRLLLVLRINDNCNRSVIHKCYFHHGAKFPALHVFAQISFHLFSELLVKWNCSIWMRGPDITWARPFFRFRVERELAYNQYVSVHIFHRKIHHTCAVIKNAQRGNLAAQPLDIFLGVSFFDSQKDK